MRAEADDRNAHGSKHLYIRPVVAERKRQPRGILAKAEQLTRIHTHKSAVHLQLPEASGRHESHTHPRLPVCERADMNHIFEKGPKSPEYNMSGVGRVRSFWIPLQYQLGRHTRSRPIA